ncbi:hypothetical protein PTKIN_Ptkin09bG0201100 [Pterospermum kingtungense]
MLDVHILDLRTEAEKNNKSSDRAPRSEPQTARPEAVIDMKQRYLGHCNVGTDIKQASFLVSNEISSEYRKTLAEYVACESDDGRWFIWKKRTGRLIKMLLGDDAGNISPLILSNLPCRLLALLSSWGFLFTVNDFFLSSTVVNCVQCHPFDCFMATSGTDSTIKLWTPNTAVPSMAAGGSAGPETANVLAMESNQLKLCRNQEAILQGLSL